MSSLNVLFCFIFCNLFVEHNKKLTSLERKLQIVMSSNSKIVRCSVMQSAHETLVTAVLSVRIRKTLYAENKVVTVYMK